MRRLLSILLMMVLALPLLASVFGSAQAEARLPACCRRSGAHHCAGMNDRIGMPAQGEQQVLRMACSAYAQSLGQMHTAGWLFQPAWIDALGIPVEQMTIGQAEAGFRISQGRAWQKRGPPSRTKSQLFFATVLLPVALSL